MTTPNLGLELPPDGSPAWGGAIRAAFSTLDAVIGTSAQERTQRLILAAVQYARDVNDRMRVVVDNTVSATITGGPYIQGPSSTTYPYRTWYAAEAAFTMDQRDVQRQQSLINGEIARQKWTYT